MGLLLITISIIAGFWNIFCSIPWTIGLFIMSITWPIFAPDAFGAKVPGGPVAIGNPGKAGAGAAPVVDPVPVVVVAVVAEVVAAGLAAAVLPPFTRCKVCPSSTL